MTSTNLFSITDRRSLSSYF